MVGVDVSPGPVRAVAVPGRSGVSVCHLRREVDAPHRTGELDAGVGGDDIGSAATGGGVPPEPVTGRAAARARRSPAICRA